LDRLGLSVEVAGSGYHPIRRVRLTTPRGRALGADGGDPHGRPRLGLGRAFLRDPVVRRAPAARAGGVGGSRRGGARLREGRGGAAGGGGWWAAGGGTRRVGLPRYPPP